MDYQFYVKKVATLKPDVVEALVRLAQNVPMGGNPNYRLQPDEGYHTYRKIINHSKTFPLEPIDPEVEAAVKDLPLITFDRLWYYEINRLDGGTSLEEHSDSYKGSHINTTHCVHVPLTGGARYFFRRDQRYDLEEEIMEIGGVYLYNNYTFHQVKNTDIDKINLILFYGDGKWNLKKQIYEEFGFQFKESI